MTQKHCLLCKKYCIKKIWYSPESEIIWMKLNGKKLDSDCPEKVVCMGNPCIVHSCRTGEVCALDNWHGLCEPTSITKWLFFNN